MQLYPNESGAEDLMPELIDAKRKFAAELDTEHDQRGCWKKRGCNLSHADEFNEALLTGEMTMRHVDRPGTSGSRTRA